MMTGESVLELYENLFTPAFKLQRHARGLTLKDRGLLICDAFTGFHSGSAGLDVRRMRWSEETNVRLPEAQPGGWSGYFGCRLCLWMFVVILAPKPLVRTECIGMHLPGGCAPESACATS